MFESGSKINAAVLVCVSASMATAHCTSEPTVALVSGPQTTYAGEITQVIEMYLYTLRAACPTMWGWILISGGL